MLLKIRDYTASNLGRVKSFAQEAPTALVIGAVTFVAVGVGIGASMWKSKK